MHDIEPHYHWRDRYIASDDEQSPFFGRTYSEFSFTNKVYNYFIHPQWDEFGSSTLYTKLLYTDYEEGFAILEMIGEWNDCLQNDIMFFKRNIADHLIEHGINKYVIICENVLNFHGSDNCYYQEWWEDIIDGEGWVCLINTLDHVTDEMEETHIQHYVHVGHPFNNVIWRPLTPRVFFQTVESAVESRVFLENGQND